MNNDLEINSDYNGEGFLNIWNSNSSNKAADFSNGKTKMIVQPYRCFALEDFIRTENAAEFYDSLRQECRSFKYFKKNNDLYQFKQTNDLSKLKVGPCVRKVMNFFSKTVKAWLQRLTGIELSDYVALTVSNYEFTDTLLCHDDELDKRRIAFVLYLSNGWRENFGGQLDTFSTDEYNRPVKIVERITPAENMFSFFEVQPNSFHQVSEVLEPNQSRLSINGWYHGISIVRPPVIPEAPLPLVFPGFVDYDDVIGWINPEYLNPDVQTKIRCNFEDESQIELRNFLQFDKYNAVCEELRSSNVTFVPKVPYNKRNYFVLDESSKDKCPTLPILLKLMTSEAVFLLVSQLTGLKFHRLFEENTGDDQCDSTVANDGASTSDDKKRSLGDIDEDFETKRFKTTNEGDESSSCVLDHANGDPVSLPSCSSKIQSTLNYNLPKDGNETDSLAKCSVELRKFNHKCYTLMHDVENSPDNENEFCLDLQLFFTEHDWKIKQGGYTCYVAKGEDEELLTVVPKSNSLALVYRGEDTMKFVKYINSRAGDKEFIDLSMTFIENK